MVSAPCVCRGEFEMIKLAGIGHVLLRVTDEEASKRFYRYVLGFRVAEQDPEHGGVFVTLGDGFHTLDLTQPPGARRAAGRGGDWPGGAAMAKVERLRQGARAAE